MILFWLFAICRTIGQTVRTKVAALPWSVFGQARQNVDLAPSRFAPFSEQTQFRRGAFAPSAEDEWAAPRRFWAGLCPFPRAYELGILSVPAPPGGEHPPCVPALV
jgi:hypothetical protein